MLGYATDLSGTSFGNKTVRALCSWRRMEGAACLPTADGRQDSNCCCWSALMVLTNKLGRIAALLDDPTPKQASRPAGRTRYASEEARVYPSHLSLSEGRGYPTHVTLHWPRER